MMSTCRVEEIVEQTREDVKDARQTCRRILFVHSTQVQPRREEAGGRCLEARDGIPRTIWSAGVDRGGTRTSVER